METDNTYMLFDGTCGAQSLPTSVTDVIIPYYQTISTKRVQRYHYAQLENIKKTCDELERSFKTVYETLDGSGDPNTPFYKYILLCVQTGILMVRDTIINFSILIIKGVWTVAMTILIVPLLLVLKGITELIRISFQKGPNIKEKIHEIISQLKSGVVDNWPSIVGYFFQLFQSVAFGMSMKKLVSDAPNLTTPTDYTIQKNIIEKKAGDYEASRKNFGTSALMMMKESTICFFNKDKAMSGFNISSIPKTLVWGSVSYLSRKGAETLKFFFSRTKEKVIGDSKSIIWSKFESIMNGTIEYLSSSEKEFTKKFEESARELQKTVIHARSRWEIANRLLQFPIYIFNFSYSLVYWGAQVSLPFCEDVSKYLFSYIDHPIIFGLTPIYCTFLAMAIVRLLGSCYNMIAYKTCLTTVCDKIGESEITQLEQRTCADQCWAQGVDGIASLCVPEKLIYLISQDYGSYVGGLLVFHENIVKASTATLLIESSGVPGNVVGFYNRGVEAINTNFDWNYKL